MIKRKSLSPRYRESFFTRMGGKCAQCGCKPMAYHIDHIIPLENGGDDNEDNFQILCHDCHKVKTKSDIKLIAKVRSVRQKHEGHKRPKQSIQSRGFNNFKKKPLIDKSKLTFGVK